jgi:hypothetical protein
MSAAHTPLRIHIHLPVYSGSDLVQLVVWRVGQGVDIGGKAGGGGCIDAGDMVIYAYLYKALACVSFYCPHALRSFLPPRLFNYLFVGRLDWLLDEVDQIWRAKFAECREAVGSDLDNRVCIVFEQSGVLLAK